MNCFYDNCPVPPEVFCECSGVKTYLCSYHLDSHFTTTGSTHQTSQIYEKIGLDFKKRLLSSMSDQLNYYSQASNFLVKESIELIKLIKLLTQVHLQKITKESNRIRTIIQTLLEDMVSRTEINNYYAMSKTKPIFREQSFNLSDIKDIVNSKFHQHISLSLTRNIQSLSAPEKLENLRLKSKRFDGGSYEIFSVTANSKFIITSSQDTLIRLWQVKQMEKHSKLRGHNCGNIYLAVHEDILYSYSADEKCTRVWSLINFTQVRIIDSEAWRLIFRNKDAFIISKSQNDLKIINTSYPNDPRMLNSLNEVKDLDINENCNYIALATGLKLQILRFSNLLKHKEFTFKKEISCIRFVSDDLLIVIDTNKILLYSIQSEKEKKNAYLEQIFIKTITLSIDKKYLALLYNTKSSIDDFSIWEIPSLKLMYRTTKIFSCAFLPFTNNIAILSADSLLIFDILQKESDLLLINSKVEITAVASHKQYAILVLANGTFIVYDIQDNSQKNIFKIHESKVNALIVKEDIVYSCSENFVVAWNMHTGVQDCKIKYKAEVVSLCLTHNLQYLLASYNNIIAIYNFEEAKILWTLKAKNPVIDIKTYKDDLIYAGESNGVIEVWKFPNIKVDDIASHCISEILGFAFNENYIFYHSINELFFAVNLANMNSDLRESLMSVRSTLGVNIKEAVENSAKKEFNKVVGGFSILKGNDIRILMHPFVREDDNSIVTVYHDNELKETKLSIYNSLYNTTEDMKLDKKGISCYFPVSLNKIIACSGSYLCVLDIDQNQKMVKKSLSIQSVHYYEERALYGCINGKVYLFDSISNKTISCFDEFSADKCHSGAVIKVRLSEGYAISGARSEVRIWDLSQRKLVYLAKSIERFKLLCSHYTRCQ